MIFVAKTAATTVANATPEAPAAWYIVAVVAIMFVVTFGLRALPFAVLSKLRDSKFVHVMALWMPAGILGLLAIIIFTSTASAPDSSLWKLLVASTVTVVSHLSLGRRTLVSIGLGTVTYVVLVNFVP